MWEHFPLDVKKATLGKMASNNLAKSSFSGVTAQSQCNGQIDMCSAATVSENARNGFLDHPTTKKQMEVYQQVLFHGLPDELQITLVMVAMEDGPEKRQSNNNDLNRQHTMQHMEADLTQEKGFEHAEDEFIEALIYHRMWSSASLWKTIGAVTEGLKKLKYKKYNLGALKDNIQIRYLGLG